ncbi:MAG: DNA mismatch repair protein MutS [Thermodesulfovibrionales bacterium]
MKQYQGIKEKHQDAIVLFRLGDFYEMFGEDAKTASAILQIALTTRDKGKDDPMPMCGIPYFASETYISKLIRAGKKVAICEQVEDPREAKGIVQREVVRVITPGTHTPEHPRENNYIMSLLPEGRRMGIAVADASTGEFMVYETSKPLEDEISRFEPAEVVIPESLADNIHFSESLRNYYVSPLSEWSYDYAEAYRVLLSHFGVSSLEGYGCEGMTAAISAAGALVAYLEEARKGDIRFRKLTPLNEASFMFLDAPTQRNLELVRNLKDGSREGTLLWVLDETLTPMGARYLRNAVLRPLTEAGAINARLGAVRALVEDFELSEGLRRNLRKIQDMERLAQRVATGGANARDLAALRSSVENLPAVRSALASSRDSLLSALAQAMPEFSDLEDLLARGIAEHPPAALRDGGIIRAGFNDQVDELRAMSVNAKDYIAALEAEEKRKTGISSLKVGYNRIYGYYIEVTRSNLPQVPEDYIRKQTLVNGERFITPELKELESKVLGAEERLKALEYEVFGRIVEKVKERVPDLMEASGAVAVADFLLSLSVVAKRHDYSMPHVDEGSSISIVNGRHPVIERLPLAERFIPNDTALDMARAKLLIITGPNMAGKSTYMRQVALIVLMAQIGSFVPAEEASVGVVDRIFTRIGASDYLTRGQSTFMVEMIETANILNNATDRSLILLDEVGRGTSTFDGISIAWATAEYIARSIGARTLFATHYNELTDLPHSLEGARNFNVAVKEWGDEIIFLRKIEQGPADKSYGIQVARLAGLPDEVVEKAKEVLKRLEKQHASGAASRAFRQLDLFGAKRESALEDILALDTEAVSPQEALALLRELKDRMKP